MRYIQHGQKTLSGQIYTLSSHLRLIEYIRKHTDWEGHRKGQNTRFYGRYDFTTHLHLNNFSVFCEFQRQNLLYFDRVFFMKKYREPADVEKELKDSSGISARTIISGLLKK